MPHAPSAIAVRSALCPMPHAPCAMRGHITGKDVCDGSFRRHAGAHNDLVTLPTLPCTYLHAISKQSLQDVLDVCNDCLHDGMCMGISLAADLASDTHSCRFFSVETWCKSRLNKRRTPAFLAGAFLPKGMRPPLPQIECDVSMIVPMLTHSRANSRTVSHASRLPLTRLQRPKTGGKAHPPKTNASARLGRKCPCRACRRRLLPLPLFLSPQTRLSNRLVC